jgi:hypothetical protein
MGVEARFVLAEWVRKGGGGGSHGRHNEPSSPAQKESSNPT